MEFILWWNEVINLKWEYIQRQKFIRWKVSLLICKIASFIKKEKGCKQSMRQLFWGMKTAWEMHIKKKKGRNIFSIVILTSFNEVYLRIPNASKEHNFPDSSFVFGIYFLRSNSHLLGFSSYSIWYFWDKNCYMQRRIAVVLSHQFYLCLLLSEQT